MLPLGLGFEYDILCERHNNVSASINNNVRLIIKELVADLKEKLGPTLERDYGQISTDYEYVIAGLNWLSFYAHEKNRKTQYVFSKKLDIKIKNNSRPVEVTIMLADDCDGVHGMFTHDNDKLEIWIQMEMIDLDSPEGLYNNVGIVRMLQTYLGHELMHCYQYITKNNYNLKQYSLAAEAIPKKFSYLYYFLQSNELEAVAMSAYTQYRRLKRRGWTYLVCLLRTMDFALSNLDHKRANKRLTPQYLRRKYINGGEDENFFILKYMLAIYIPQSRFYVLCSNDKNYKSFVALLKKKNIETRKNLIDKIYNFLEKILKSKNPYNYLKQAFYLVGNSESFSNICKSTNYTMDAYNKMTTKNFSTADAVYDEEEDTVTHGRPDRSYD